MLIDLEDDAYVCHKNDTFPNDVEVRHMTSMIIRLML